MSGFDPTGGMPVWFARRPGTDGGTRLACVLGDRHPYRHVVDVDGTDEPAPVLYRSDYRPDGEMTRAVIAAEFQKGAVDLWYCELPEPDAEPPATNLVAFSSSDWPDGTVVAADALLEREVDLREQVGALRWWVRTGQVHQIYVAAHMRRRKIATKLVLTGAAMTVGRRWPSLWATGELTDLGHQFVSGAVWSSRVAPRSRHLPPMTPPGDGSG